VAEQPNRRRPPQGNRWKRPLEAAAPVFEARPSPSAPEEHGPGVPRPEQDPTRPAKEAPAEFIPVMSPGEPAKTMRAAPSAMVDQRESPLVAISADANTAILRWASCAVAVFGVAMIGAVLFFLSQDDDVPDHNRQTDTAAAGPAAGTTEEGLPLPRNDSPGALHPSPLGRESGSAAPPGLRCGTQGQWTGELERIWGLGGMSPEIHFLVKLDPPVSGATHVEGFVTQAAFAREVLDYETREEREEALGGPGDSAVSGDRVTLAGTVDSPERVNYRIGSASTPLVRIDGLQRAGSPHSAAVVGRRRPEESFAGALDTYALKNVLRVLPDPGPALTLTGCFQGHEPRAGTVLVGMGPSGRAAEIEFPGGRFTQLQPGDTVTVVAAPTGKVFQRVVGGIMMLRPQLIGTTLSQRSERGGWTVCEPAAREDDSGGPPPADRTQPVVRAEPADPVQAGADPMDNCTRNAKRRGPHVFVVSEEGATALRVGNRWRTLDLPATFPHDIHWCYTDSRAACWLAGKGGLARIDGTTTQLFGSDDGLPRDPLSHVFEDSRGRLWVSSWGGGVARFEGGQWQTLTTRDGLWHDDVNGCAEDANGRIWITGGGGMVAGVKGVTIFAEERLQRNAPGSGLPLNVMSVDADPEGRVFLGCIGGLVVIHPDMSVRKITVDEGLPQKTPQATFVDSRGRIWLGTWGGGVVQVDPTHFEVLGEHALPEAGHVRRIAEDSEGVIWAGSLEGLWNLQDGNWHKVPTPASFRRVQAVAAVSDEVATKLAEFASDMPNANDRAEPLPAGIAPRPANSRSPAAESSANAPSAEDVEDYLSKSGKLRGTLRLDEELRATFNLPDGSHMGTVNLTETMTVGSGGGWTHSWRVFGVARNGNSVDKSGNDTGQFSASQLEGLGRVLARQDLLGLPKRLSSHHNIPADRASVVRSIRLRFRSHASQITFEVDTSDEGDPRATAPPRQEALRKRYEQISTFLRSVSKSEPDLDW